MANARFLQALAGRNEGRPPLWIMRQAGRYLPEYRALRAKHSFHEMTHRSDLIAEVTLLPLRRFAFDAAILFSDILVVGEAFGKTFSFIDGKGPVLEVPLSSAQDVDRLPNPDLSSLAFVADGIRELLPSLTVPLIGFCGGPFTVASYLIEGGASRDLRKTKRWMWNDPVSFHKLLQSVTRLSIAYLQTQLAAGVHAVQIFDSWANVLAYPQFQEYCLPYLKAILDGIGGQVPAIVYCRGSSVFAEALANIQPSAVGIDWNADLAAVRRRVGKGVALQGNLDPDMLYAPASVLERQVRRLLNAMRGDPSYIFNLGHGVPPDVPVESMALLTRCVQESELATAGVYE